MRKVARTLYWQGWRIASIARHLDIKPATVASWCRREKWKDSTPVERIEASLEVRMMALIAKDKKDGADYKEIDLLGRQVERLARVRKYDETGKESDLNPKIASRNAGPKRRAPRNEISEEQHKRIIEAFRESLFDYQKVWYRNGDQRTRNILKSRQIGATWYFAREALVDALVIRNGRLQFDAGWIDLAASFMAIKQTMTASGRQSTYTAGRNDETGHADLAWACLHAIDREPLAGGGIHSSSFTEFYS
ncbi:hypothetical protein WS70_00855 [Burkholderia mayonis]|uniref:Terminase n=1 Tax=Burkholderia mayonis TaxID=1385591 RepID=A0A1B4FA37_9BURK|nr:hypothetical protein WS70_00855 [Burkholderia mayonis]KVE34885.1 hypothetical protein WS69_15925 [Burkholderia sp. BDU5]